MKAKDIQIGSPINGWVVIDKDTVYGYAGKYIVLLTLWRFVSNGAPGWLSVLEPQFEVIWKFEEEEIG